MGVVALLSFLIAEIAEEEKNGGWERREGEDEVSNGNVEKVGKVGKKGEGDKVEESGEKDVVEKKND